MLVRFFIVDKCGDVFPVERYISTVPRLTERVRIDSEVYKVVAVEYPTSPFTGFKPPDPGPPEIRVRRYLL